MELSDKKILAKLRDRKPFVLGRFEVIVSHTGNDTCLIFAEGQKEWYETCPPAEFAREKAKVAERLKALGFPNL